MRPRRRLDLADLRWGLREALFTQIRENEAALMARLFADENFPLPVVAVTNRNLAGQEIRVNRPR